MATIFGIRDYGFGKWKKFVWGFEWTNLMITYTSRHRPGGEGTWYTKQQYNYSSINNRRWGAHSGSDSDDWYLYGGFINDNYIVIQSINYERHGIVTYRPAEIKLEYSIDVRYKYRDFWYRLFYERQFEAFLGFPDYFYEDKYSNELDDPSGKIAKSRITNTLIFSISKYFSL